MPNDGPKLRAARQPGEALSRRSRSRDGVSFCNLTGLTASMRDQLEMDSHLEPTDDDVGLLAANPTTPNTIAVYGVNISAGRVRVGGVFARLGAAVDQVLIGAGQDIPTYKLDGTAAVVLSADGKTFWLALVEVVDAGSVVHRAVVGAEADDTSELELSVSDVDTALRAALASGLDPTLEPDAWLSISAIKVQRVAVDTITYTHTNPATDDVLAEERSRGYSIDPNV